MKINWIRDLLIIPLVVGLVVAAFTIFTPKIFDEEKEISFQIDPVSEYLNDPALGNLDVQIDGQKIEELFSYKVKLWNSGDVPLKDLSVQLRFSERNPQFKVFTASISTTPAYEFGKISEEKVDPFSTRYTFELINPKDSVTLTFFTSAKSGIQFFTKAESLAVKEVKEKEENISEKFIPVIAVLASVLAMIFSKVFRESNLVALQAIERVVKELRAKKKVEQGDGSDVDR